MAKFDLREYARRGAETRVAELHAELAQIYRMFPDMRRGGSNVGTAPADSQTVAPHRRRRRKGMSAAQKKAVSVRMRRYWAARRQAEST